jgi:hypothetical protein
MPALRTVAWSLLVVAAGGAGFAAGLRQGHGRLISGLQREASGNLTQRIEVLSFLRFGEASEAIRRLEGEADTLTRTIAANPGPDRRALAFMKT